jgi:hypothetical protein
MGAPGIFSSNKVAHSDPPASHSVFSGDPLRKKTNGRNSLISGVRGAIRIDAGRISAQLTLVALLVQQRKMEELDPALEAAERAVPDNLTPYYTAVVWCPPNGMPIQHSEAYLRKYLAQEPEPNMPTHAATHHLLGLHLYEAGRKEEGVSELQLAVKMDPNSLAKEDLKKLK